MVPENRQRRGLNCGHGVPDGRILEPSFVLTMPDLSRTRMLGGDILNQRSSACDVHDLDPPANTKDRDAITERGVEEIDFELIAVRIDAIGRRVNVVVSVPDGIDIGSSTEEETID